ncbi:MAG: hypothetical protein AB2L21_06920 [Anaerolineaceae bacterium]
MKKNTVILIVVLLLTVFLLDACSSATPEPTEMVALPAVSFGEGTPDASMAGNEEKNNVDETYPLTETDTTGTSSTYPVTGGESPTKSMTDTEIEALIVEKLQGHHTLDWLLNFEYTREQWDQLLSSHHDVTFTPEEKGQVIDWLLAH